MENQENKRISLDDAANAVASLYFQIEESGDLSDSIIEKYLEFEGKISESIDRRKYALREADSKIQLAKNMKEDLDDQIKRYRKIHESIIESTKKIIIENESVSFKDSMGKRVFVQKNPIPRLECHIETHTETFHNCLSDDSYCKVCDYYEEYIDRKTVYILNTKKIKEDMINGKFIPWANLVPGYQIRGMK